MCSWARLNGRTLKRFPTTVRYDKCPLVIQTSQTRHCRDVKLFNLKIVFRISLRYDLRLRDWQPWLYHPKMCKGIQKISNTFYYLYTLSVVSSVFSSYQLKYENSCVLRMNFNVLCHIVRGDPDPLSRLKILSMSWKIIRHVFTRLNFSLRIYFFNFSLEFLYLHNIVLLVIVVFQNSPRNRKQE